MSLIVAGASYKTADIATREAIAVPQSEVPAALERLLSANGVKSAAILSTCNRVEVYLDAKTDALGTEAALDFLFERAGWPREEGDSGSGIPITDDCASQGIYVHRGPDTAKHMFRVICSLDSQVLGEAQILGQMKHAYEDSVAAGACDEVMAKLFKTAIHLGKQARSETAIGSDSVSLSTTAFQAAKRNVEDLSACDVVLLGAGEMAKLVANYLAEERPAHITVISRTVESAGRLAEALEADVLPFEERYGAVAAADIVFSMMSAQTPVIEKDALEEARIQAGRSDARLVIIDEGVPRNIEYSCSSIDGVTLIDQEMLGSFMDEGLAKRMASVDQVEKLVDAAQKEFLGWMQERMVAPTIKEMYEKGEYTLSLELDRARKEMRKVARKEGREVTEEEDAVLEAFGNAVMKKMLHGPVMRLRKNAQTADSYYYTGAARYLFGLDAYPAGTHRHCHDKRCLKGEPCPIGYEGSTQQICLQREDGE